MVVKMEDCLTYRVNGKDYLDVKGAAKKMGVAPQSLHNLMRGVEFGSLNKFDFKRIKSKILIKISDLDVVKEAFELSE